MSRGFFVEANVCGSDECVSVFAVLYEQKKSCAAHRFLVGRPPLIERLRRIYFLRAARKYRLFEGPLCPRRVIRLSLSKMAPPARFDSQPGAAACLWSELEAEPRLKKNVRSTPSGDGESVERGVRGLRSKDRFARARFARVRKAALGQSPAPTPLLTNVKIPKMNKNRYFRLLT